MVVREGMGAGVDMKVWIRSARKVAETKKAVER